MYLGYTLTLFFSVDARMALITRLLSFVLLLSLAGPSLADSMARQDRCPTLDVSNPSARVRLMQYVCYHIADPGQQAYEAKAPDQLPGGIEWTRANGHDLVFSHTESTYWLRLHLTNRSAGQFRWYLKLNYPLLDEVTFWQSSPFRDTRPIVTGDRRPFSSRGIDYRYFLLPVTLDQGETTDITVRIHSSGALNIPLTLETPQEVIESSNHLTLTHGLFYGAVTIFAAFNLLLFFSSGTFYYFYNAFYMASMGLFLFAMGGFANQYFWPDNPDFANTAIPLLLGFCALAMTLFGRSFLEVIRGSAADRTLKFQAWACVVAVTASLFLPYHQTIISNTVLALAVIASLFVCAAVRWRQGYQPAIWYLLAWMVMLLGGLIYALAAFGYLTDFLASESLMQITIGGQVILLNYAMVQRWRLLNQKLLDVEHNARTELEVQVHERTAQLRKAMRELEKANRSLSNLSLNDALTGLYNRRHLDNCLPELCAEARRTAKPLSLALIDADRFKSVNDTWGHSFGDECLRRIADVLTRHTKRPRDVAIRFGGEEFALLLPETDREGAEKVCSEILHDIRHVPIESPDGTAVNLTLSAGIAELQAAEDRDRLFRRADDALYQAKSSGRNRVVISETVITDLEPDSAR